MPVWLTVLQYFGNGDECKMSVNKAESSVTVVVTLEQDNRCHQCCICRLSCISGSKRCQYMYFDGYTTPHQCECRICHDCFIEEDGVVPAGDDEVICACHYDQGQVEPPPVPVPLTPLPAFIPLPPPPAAAPANPTPPVDHGDSDALNTQFGGLNHGANPAGHVSE